MLKLVVTGIWVAIVTAAAAYFSAGLMSQPAGTGAQEAEYLGIEQMATPMASVPMIRGGVVMGYVIVQLTYAVDKARLKDLKLEPTPYLIDAAFRAVYENPQTDFTRLRASDIDHLTDLIAQEANKRIGGDLVRQVLIQQLNYVRKQDIRTHWIKE